MNAKQRYQHRKMIEANKIAADAISIARDAAALKDENARLREAVEHLEIVRDRLVSEAAYARMKLEACAQQLSYSLAVGQNDQNAIRGLKIIVDSKNARIVELEGINASLKDKITRLSADDRDSTKLRRRLAAKQARLDAAYRILNDVKRQLVEQIKLKAQEIPMNVRNFQGV